MSIPHLDDITARRVHTLCLSHNHLKPSGVNLRAICALPSLRILDLSNNRLTHLSRGDSDGDDDQGRGHEHGHEHEHEHEHEQERGCWLPSTLEVVDLSHNDVVSIDGLRLERCMKLRTLKLAHTKVNHKYG